MAVKPLDTLLAIKVINLAPGLRPSDRKVAAALIEHFNRRSGRCDPSLRRIADLLGYCTRTAIRSTQRLEASGLFRKVRHGGYSNRNSYEPNWARFAEFHAAWNIKFQEDARARRSKLSPAQRHEGHLRGDKAVTQTYSSNNLQTRTFAKGQPSEAKKGEGAYRVPLNRFPNRSADVARNQAERRWTDDLLEMFASKPVTYGEVVELITPAMQSAATDAEMKVRGGGLASIVRQLKLGDVK